MSRKLDVVTLDGEEYDSLLADVERYRWLRHERDARRRAFTAEQQKLTPSF